MITIKRNIGGERGYVLMAATVFAFILLLGGMTVFSIAYGESRNTRYKQESWEAFYLADSAMERARARLLSDASWRDGWVDVDFGNGTYTLSIKDTTHAVIGDCIKMVGTGTSGGATRSIEAFCELVPACFAHTMVITGEVEVHGNVCIEGLIYVGEWDDTGNGKGKGKGNGGDCDVTYTEYVVTPPAMYTDADHFPGASYYDVRAVKSGVNWLAHVFDGDGVEITTALGDSLVGIVSSSGSLVTYAFNSDAKIAKYFDDATGIFKRKTGDSSVVVNFGNGGVTDPPGTDCIANLDFSGSSNPSIHATIVNSRFTGVTELDRLESDNWEGGKLDLSKVTFEPYNGIAFIVHNIDKDQGQKVYIGTDTWPALIMVTKSALDLHPNFHTIGTIICLDEWSCFGNQNIQYNPGYIENLPAYLTDPSSTVVSSVVKIQTWKEI